MNTYDPRDGIVYRHMDRQRDPYSVPVTSTPRIDRLPSGYANGSPRTYLGSRRLPPAGSGVTHSALSPTSARAQAAPSPATPQRSM